MSETKEQANSIITFPAQKTCREKQLITLSDAAFIHISRNRNRGETEFEKQNVEFCYRTTLITSCYVLSGLFSPLTAPHAGI